MVEPSVPFPVRRMLGVRIHAADMKGALDVCRRAVSERRSLNIGVVNAAKIVKMRSDSFLREAVLQSDLILADGLSVVWASRLLGKPLPERVAGIDLFERLLELADRDGLSVFFLGAKQSVLDELLRRVHSRYPGIRIAGARNGYFDEGESDEVAREIARTRPQLLFIGITSPKKEIFLAKHGKRIRAAVCHGVGGSFDILAGQVDRAPRVLQQIGMEWFYRVIQEPRRLWKRYLVTNSLFLAMVFRELLQRHPSSPAEPS